jgi:branched-chain amino acid transport system permease protein
VTQFLEFLFNGIALGAIYALIALGFTVIYRASQVINFAQGSFLLLGAYLVAWLHVEKGVAFAVSVLIAIAVTAAVGALFQIAVLRRVTGQPVFTIVMITIGLNVVLTSAVPAIISSIGQNGSDIGDPWGSSTVDIGGVTLTWVKVWTVITALGVLFLFFLFDRYSRYGLAMRATASDEEAALAVGVPTRRVNALAWGIAGAVGVVGAFFLAGFPSRADPLIGLASLRAFPAVILGGLESPSGAVVGGLIIGVVEVLTSGYQPNNAAWLGTNFYIVAPYIVMILVLLVRPYGLFGQRPVERV